MRHRIPILVAALAVGIGWSVPVASATNYCGTQDHGIWLIQKFQVGYGSKGNLSRYNSQLVACTSGAQNHYASSHHTYGVRLSADWSSWVEVGITRRGSIGDQLPARSSASGVSTLTSCNRTTMQTGRPTACGGLEGQQHPRHLQLEDLVGPGRRYLVHPS